MHKIVWYAVGAVILVGVLSFAYYALSPLFINIKVDEALPGAKTAEETQGEVEEMPEEVPVTKTTASPVVDTLAHPASGLVRIVEAEGKTYIRYENYKTINGPDIYVYLAKDLEAKEFIDLGKVKATEGNINYEIPTDLDLAEYRYVLTWCKAFGVLFNYADLSIIDQLHV